MGGEWRVVSGGWGVLCGERFEDRRHQPGGALDGLPKAVHLCRTLVYSETKVNSHRCSPRWAAGRRSSVWTP